MWHARSEHTRLEEGLARDAYTDIAELALDDAEKLIDLLGAHETR